MGNKNYRVYFFISLLTIPLFISTITIFYQHLLCLLQLWKDDFTAVKRLFYSCDKMFLQL